jgi:hypothetical protein
MMLLQDAPPAKAKLTAFIALLQAKSKMSKSEKAKTKKEKAKTFNAPAASKVNKNAKRWN